MDSRPIVEVRNLSKRFPGVQALKDVDLSVASGSCHALCGENGAGKSTLGKILGGLYEPDDGQVIIDGEPVHFRSPLEATAAGIGIVHQELLFCENLSVADNLCLGDLPHNGPFVDERKCHRLAAEWLAKIGANVNPKQLVGSLPISKQQLVQIAGAVGKGARVLIFDEPTSSLSQGEAVKLFGVIKDLKATGVTCIYVSHRLEEIYELCDTITVLRDGKIVCTKPASELSRNELVESMIGRELDESMHQSVKSNPGDELLRVERLSSPRGFDDVTFSLRAGEVLGLGGLVGAGRTEIAEALFGLDPLHTGSIFLHGRPVRPKSPVEAMKMRLGLVPEDRKRHGLVLSLNARENVSLPILKRLSLLGWVKRTAERSFVRSYFDRMRVKAPSLDSATAGLSGGNQQKLVIAKWLAAQCDILIVDEPTRGVDVGAKAEIHTLVRELAEQGKAVLLISSDLPELISLSTRIIVLREGRQVGELSHSEATEEAAMRLMAGVTTAKAS